MIIEKVQPMSMRKGQYLYALEKFQTGFVYLYLGMLQQRGDVVEFGVLPRNGRNGVTTVVPIQPPLHKRELCASVRAVSSEQSRFLWLVCFVIGKRAVGSEQ